LLITYCTTMFRSRLRSFGMEGHAVQFVIQSRRFLTVFIALAQFNLFPLQWIFSYNMLINLTGFYLFVLHPVAYLSNWFLVIPSIATKFQYATPPFLMGYYISIKRNLYLCLLYTLLYLTLHVSAIW
jgi:hypothetical protein